MFKFWLFVLLITGFSQMVQAKVLINEFITSTSEEDQQGTNLEWLELFNASEQVVSLQDYGISDDPEVPKKWRFPDISIEPGGYLLVWATGYGYFEDDRYHTNFRLSRDGETLLLSNASGEIVDQISYPKQQRDVSYGRSSDGAGDWHYFEDPTPNAPNQNGKLGWLDPPIFSHQAQVRADRFRLELEASDNASIRYTTDGSPPSENSQEYSSPILIDESTVIRAQSFRAEFLPSESVTHSFIIQDEQPLPILTIVTDPDNLWDSRTGIYTNASQHGIAWERPCETEFFTTDGQRAFVEACGLRMHGGASRNRSPKKSFRFYFRSDYGATHLEYPLFPNAGVERFNQIVIRAGFNDQWGYDNNSQRPTAIFVSDQVCRDLHEDMGQMVSQGIWVELYVNGEYFGLYNPVERIEQDMFVQHYGFDLWDVIQDDEVADGEIDAWREFMGWVNRANFRAPDVYQEFKERVNEENFITYMLTNIFLQNYDWPHHNWYAYRARQPLGQWHFMMWDAEYSFGSGSNGFRIDQNTFEDARSKGPIGVLFNKLLQNSEFTHQFWLYSEQMLNSVLSQDHLLAQLNKHLDIVRPIIPKEAERWGYARNNLPQMTIDDWEEAAALARRFIQRRESIYRDLAEDVLGPPPVHVENWMLLHHE